MRLEPGRIDWDDVAGILPTKCAHRGVTVAAVGDVFAPEVVEEVRAAWERTLGPFVETLPDVEIVLAETRDRLEALLRISPP